MKKENWVWMPHPGHFCAARDCRFYMNTYVGGYIVSTVGEYEPCMQVREINAEVRGIKLQGRGDARRADAMEKLGWEKIGLERTYETMVFEAHKTKHPEAKKCCPYEINVGKEVDFDGYKNAGDAYAGHLKLCRKWAAK